jgi:hypothetical protein
MGVIAVISNAQNPVPVEIVSQGGAFATVSLIISLSMAFLIADSMYWNRWASSTLDACADPLLITFTAIVAFKIMAIL